MQSDGLYVTIVWVDGAAYGDEGTMRRVEPREAVAALRGVEGRIASLLTNVGKAIMTPEHRDIFSMECVITHNQPPVTNVMGNLLSSFNNTKTEQLEKDNKKLQTTVENLKDENSLSKESVKKLQTEVETQKKTIALLKKAAKEMMEDDTVCAKTRQELDKVTDENNDLVAATKTANEKHRLKLEALTNEKMQAVNQLEKELKRSEANDAARTDLSNKLREAQMQTQECLDNERKLKSSEKKCKAAQAQLLRQRSRLVVEVNRLRRGIGYERMMRMKQSQNYEKDIIAIREKRPIAMDRINNASESVAVNAESIKVSFANVDIKPTYTEGPSAQGVLAVSYRASNNRVDSVTIRFSGNGNLSLHDSSGRRFVKENMTSGSQVTAELARIVPYITVKAEKLKTSKNGWAFTFLPLPEGGIYTKVAIGVEGSNPWYGLTGIQIAEVDPVAPKVRLAPKFQRKPSAPVPAKPKPPSSTRTVNSLPPRKVASRFLR